MKALLVIDPQEGFRFPNIEYVIKPIQEYISSFNGLKIVTSFIDIQDSPFERLLDWTKFQDYKHQQLWTELCTQEWDLQLTHQTYTVLNRVLSEFFRVNSITDVYLAGVYTDVCIVKTAMDLFDGGFTPFVLANHCATPHGIENHNMTIDSLKHIIGGERIIY